MGRSRQAAVWAAHIIDARRRRDAQYAAGTLHLVAFEALDFERGEVCGGIGPTQRKHNRAPYAASSVSRQRSTSPRASILRRRTRCKTTRSVATGLAIASTATARRACDI